MARWCVTKIERIEFYTIASCPSCDLALHDIILPIAKERKIPVHVLPTNDEITVVPFACIVKKVDGVEKKQCIRGYDSNYSKDFIKILEED